MVWWKKTLLTMLAGALGGVGGIISGIILGLCITHYGFIGLGDMLIAFGLSPFIGAYCAFKTSDWMRRILDRNN